MKENTKGKIKDRAGISFKGRPVAVNLIYMAFILVSGAMKKIG